MEGSEEHSTRHHTVEEGVGWSKVLEADIKCYLVNGTYPTRCRGKEEKRSFRRRAQSFCIEDGRLRYKYHKNGTVYHRIPLTSQEEQKQAFQVCFYMSPLGTNIVFFVYVSVGLCACF